MRPAEVSLDELELWNLAYSIRGFVESQSFYFGVNPLPDGDGTTLISAVEQIFLTEGMMLAFLRDSEPEGMFASDLRKWGVIQALVVQQDAVDFLALILKQGRLNPSKDPVLSVIREDLRNRYVGHPVSDQIGNRKATKFVVTAGSESMEACFIELGAGGLNVRRFNLRSAIGTQRKALMDFVENLKSKVMEQEEEFREAARASKPLDAIRHSTFCYNLSKSHPEDDGMPSHNAKELLSQLALFRRAFEDVGRLTQWIELDLNSMDYAASQVAAYHEAEENERRLVADDVSVFLSFLEHKHDRLLDYVREIEEEISEPAS